MKYCPACGLPNPDSARYCSECHSSLLGTARIKANPLETPIEPEGPAAARAEKPSRLSYVSALLGLLGLGPVAVVLGWLAIRRNLPGREFAYAGMALGAFGTVLVTVLIVTSLGRGDPLQRMTVTPDNLPQFTRAVETRCERLEEEADALRARLGPGGESEVASVYAIINSINEDLFDMVELDASDELASMRNEVLEKLGRARRELAGY